MHDGTAQMLRGHDDQDSVGAGGRSEIGGDRDARRERNAGQARILAGTCDTRRVLGIAGIERHGTPGARGDGGERRAPGSGADDGDGLEARHRPTPNCARSPRSSRGRDELRSR